MTRSNIDDERMRVCKAERRAVELLATEFLATEFLATEFLATVDSELSE
jgi:hypothetical protein